MPPDYQLHGLRLHAAGGTPAVRKRLRRILRHKGAKATEADASADIRLAFHVHASLKAPPDTARHVGTSARCGIEVWDAPEQMVLAHKSATAVVDPAGGRAEGQVCPALLERPEREERDPLFHLVVLSLGLLLRRRGWFPLHAATLAREGRGVLLPGRSGQGKTTIALSLLRHGWAALSDDTVLLRATGNGVRAHAFRRPLCVDPGAANYFPELEGPDWPASLSDASKWQVDVDRLYPGQSDSTCTPRLLVLPTIADAPTSRIEPIGAKLALEQLLTQSAFFLSSRPDVADRHLSVLRRLVDQTQTHRLHAGRDVLNEPHTAHALLAPLLTGGPASDAVSG
ncbi:hypothetical protein GGP72_002966 [Salinibacter ruber]|uniref:HPr kinase n=1 Tax=Salinibacter ruber TaxID=146919 RepID=A0A9X2Q8Q1_9BACT|nr:hypothetical protein [Salinibacter ruber]MCS3678741.1 hypothetical protein [Salinibacter ruber]MCS3682306.1 hypothetical protein [Salinibacter ruber]